MFKLYLFAGACVLALALVSEVYGQDTSRCVTIHRGHLAGVPIQIPTNLLPPHTPIVLVKTPRVCVHRNGVMATVCDGKVPDVDFADFDTISIHRKGRVDTLGYGSVDITEYCKPSGDEDDEISEEDPGAFSITPPN